MFALPYDGMRAANAKKTITVATVKENSKEDKSLVIWMGCEEMVRKIWERRGLHLRQSGKMESKPCPITQSDDEFLKLWAVPKELVVKTSLDRTGHTTQAENEASVDDLLFAQQKFKECEEQGGNGASSSGDGAAKPVPIKQENPEPTTPYAILSKQILEDPQAAYHTYNMLLLTARSLGAKLDGGHKYTTELQADNAASVNKLGRLVKLLERCILEKPQVKAVCDLSSSLLKAKSSHESIVNWAERLGISVDEKKAKKARKSKDKDNWT